MPGKPMKPFNQLVDQRPQRRRLGSGVTLTVVATEPPPMPDDLHPVAQDCWQQFWQSPLANLLVEAEHHLVTRYVFLISEREKLEAKEHFTRDDRQLLNLRIKEVLTLEERLGLGLLPRMRLGIATGLAGKAVDAMQHQARKPKIPVVVEIGDD